MTRFSRAERAALAELMRAVGPDAPTRCGDWTARDLAAHLVLRDRHPVASAGIVVRPLAARTARTQRRIAGRPWDTLVGQVRHPPWWSPVSNPLVDGAANTMEYFIHHEDVRRAQPGWEPRPLPADAQTRLWRRVRGVGRLTLRRFPATVTVHAPGYGGFTAGSGDAQLRLAGEPAELLLFLTGRQDVSRAEVTGPDGPAQRLRTASLGL